MTMRLPRVRFKIERLTMGETLVLFAMLPPVFLLECVGFYGMTSGRTFVRTVVSVIGAASVTGVVALSWLGENYRHK
jgi:hypothetical protein